MGEIHKEALNMKRFNYSGFIVPVKSGAVSKHLQYIYEDYFNCLKSENHKNGVVSEWVKFQQISSGDLTGYSQDVYDWLNFIDEYKI